MFLFYLSINLYEHDISGTSWQKLKFNTNIRITLRTSHSVENDISGNGKCPLKLQDKLITLTYYTNF